MAKTKYNAKEIGRISLGENQDLVVNLIDDERLDIRVYVNSGRYTGPTKRGVRFYLFDGIWNKFYEIMEKVNQEVA
jgi:hypothetical protein